jgi:hypothetical protein
MAGKHEDTETQRHKGVARGINWMTTEQRDAFVPLCLCVFVFPSMAVGAVHTYGKRQTKLAASSMLPVPVYLAT